MRGLDHSGVRYGHLVGVCRLENAGRRTRWLWRCDCGNETVADPSHVRSGHTVSCGCFFVAKCRKHGHSHNEDGEQTRTYKAWANMRSRVAGGSESGRRNYADRGIQVCPRWAASFEHFLADMGECPDGMSLDREDNDWHYEPGNCRWATPVQQSGNTRRTRRVHVDGVEMSLAAACRIRGVLYDTAMKRITKGFSAQEALDKG